MARQLCHALEMASDTGGDPKTPDPILLPLDDGDDLKPFEAQTIAIAKESLAISRRTYWFTVVGFGAALAAAIFVGSQVQIMSYQTQVMGSQSESATAGAVVGEMNTRQQLAIGQQQLRSLAIQAQAALNATRTQQAQLQLSERPWISVDVKAIPPLFFDQGGGHMEVNVALKNVGHSAAQFVGVWTSLEVGEPDLKAESKLCGMIKSPANSKSDYGHLIFPDQAMNEQQPVIADPKAIQEYLKHSPYGDDIALCLLVCVDYKSTFDSVHHQTRLIRMLGRPDWQRNIVMGAFNPKTTYGEIRLDAPMHGDSAD